VQILFGFYGTEAVKSLSGKDGRDLLGQMRKAGYTILRTRHDLARTKKQKLLGLFDDGNDAPSLAALVRNAISRLDKNPKGFFLMVEHARIDWEPGDPSGIVADVRRLDDAVGEALTFARKHSHTLVIVTADHETGGLLLQNPEQLKSCVMQRVCLGNRPASGQGSHQHRSGDGKICRCEKFISDGTRRNQKC